MKITVSKRWTEDIEEVIASLAELKRLDEKTVLITGASGLIGSSIVDVLNRYNEKNNGQIRIFAAGRNVEKIEKRFGKSSVYLNYIQYDALSASNDLPDYCDYIIHAAGNSDPVSIVKEPVEIMVTNIIGLKNLLDYAKERGTERLVYISSSEVYGKKKGNEPYKNNEYGFIDLLNSRNSYSIGKRAAETLSVSYFDEYKVDSVIVRPGHIYGPAALFGDSHVSSQWAFDVVEGKDIVMKSDGGQLRSYCYCLDCASAILTIMLKGESIHAYNISNPESVISIKEMAEILAEAGGVKLLRGTVSDEEKKSFNPMSNSSLDGSQLKTLGWKGLFNAKRGLKHTVEILKEMKDQKHPYYGQK